MSESPTEPPVEPLADVKQGASSRENSASAENPSEGSPAREERSSSAGNDDDDFDMDSESHRLKKHRRETNSTASAPETGSNDKDEPESSGSAGSKERRRPVRESSQESRKEMDAAASRRRRNEPPKGRAVRKAASQEPEEIPEEEEDEATRERKALEARIDAASQPSSKRRKKLAGDDLEAMQDEAIAQSREAMREAALKDVDCIRNGEPAINKIAMSKEVVGVSQKQALADSILDGNSLESMRIWLEPLPDASSPSFEIQKASFSALVRSPIKTIHSRESGSGRVVSFYQKSKRPQPSIKRMAQKLIGDWTRPIIGRSDNYRDKRVATAEFDPEAFSRQAATAGLASSQQNRPKEPMTPYEESAARRGRAAIPSSSGVSYRVAPLSNGAQYNAEAAVQAPGASKDAQSRRMKAKLMTSGRSGRKKSQVSVEGRGLN